MNVINMLLTLQCKGMQLLVVTLAQQHPYNTFGAWVGCFPHDQFLCIQTNSLSVVVEHALHPHNGPRRTQSSTLQGKCQSGPQTLWPHKEGVGRQARTVQGYNHIDRTSTAEMRAEGGVGWAAAGLVSCPDCERLSRGGGGVWERDYSRPSPSHVIQERGRDGPLVLTWFSNTCNFGTMGTEQKQTVDVLNMKAYVLLVTSYFGKFNTQLTTLLHTSHLVRLSICSYKRVSCPYNLMTLRNELCCTYTSTTWHACV